MGVEEYRGSEQYARAKRAQVTLNELWARHVPSTHVVFQAMHPGWADTPGVRTALPEISLDRRSAAAFTRTGRRHHRLAGLRRAGRAVVRRVLARSPAAKDPSLAAHPPLGHGAPTGTPVDLVRRAQRRRSGTTRMTPARLSGGDRIAIVGSGIAGLTCAHVLGPHHDVVLFEADGRLGGHANTVDVDDPLAGRLAVDTGFIVHNDRTLPTPGRSVRATRRRDDRHDDEFRRHRS